MTQETSWRYWEDVDWLREIYTALQQVPTKHCWFSIRTLTEIINSKHDSRMQYTPAFVGRTLAKLGFKAWNNGGKGRGWRWDTQLVEKLKREVENSEVANLETI